ncbi:unnamed protein product [Prorocentrum cordatum]|uniref:Uncharacterized protein n=1 Tax=Prorocentrum cordatum TaxID=2364126 RepID=A0ABN9PGD5_9DINO|nr:unnamed protein product [Polarella glacialis]
MEQKWLEAKPTRHGLRGPVAAACASLSRIGWAALSSVILGADEGDVIVVLHVHPRELLCAEGRNFFECPTTLATGQRDGDVIEPTSEMHAKVEPGLPVRFYSGAADQDYDAFDLVTAMPVVSYEVGCADAAHKIFRWDEWSSPEAGRSTIVDHDDSGRDAPWPERWKLFQALRHMSYLRFVVADLAALAREVT